MLYSGLGLHNGPNEQQVAATTCFTNLKQGLFVVCAACDIDTYVLLKERI